MSSPEVRRSSACVCGDVYHGRLAHAPDHEDVDLAAVADQSLDQGKASGTPPAWELTVVKALARVLNIFGPATRPASAQAITMPSNPPRTAVIAER